MGGLDVLGLDGCHASTDMRGGTRPPMAVGAGEGAAGTARLRAGPLGLGGVRGGGARWSASALMPTPQASRHPPRPYTGRAAAAAGPPTGRAPRRAPLPPAAGRG